MFNQIDENKVYKIQCEEHEKNLVQMFQAEQNYLQQIETLSTENHQLREENENMQQ